MTKKVLLAVALLVGLIAGALTLSARAAQKRAFVPAVDLFRNRTLTESLPGHWLSVEGTVDDANWRLSAIPWMKNDANGSRSELAFAADGRYEWTFIEAFTKDEIRFRKRCEEEGRWTLVGSRLTLTTVAQRYSYRSPTDSGSRETASVWPRDYWAVDVTLEERSTDGGPHRRFNGLSLFGRPPHCGGDLVEPERPLTFQRLSE